MLTGIKLLSSEQHLAKMARYRSLSNKRLSSHASGFIADRIISLYYGTNFCWSRYLYLANSKKKVFRSNLEQISSAKTGKKAVSVPYLKLALSIKMVLVVVCWRKHDHSRARTIAHNICIVLLVVCTAMCWAWTKSENWHSYDHTPIPLRLVGSQFVSHEIL